MKPVIKLKDDARKHELKEDWEKAIQVYLQVVRVGEQGEADLELPLYNRIGDLYVRLGRPTEAVSFYEQAADRYADAGLFNNAIALCNKALRYAPDHLGIIRKLGQFSASQGFLSDARRWFLDFAERASKQGQVDEALSALEDFANISDEPDVREMLGRRLHQHGREAEAVDALRRAYGMYLRAGNDERADAVRTTLLEIDPDVDLDAISDAPVAPAAPHDPTLDALPAYADAPPAAERPPEVGLLEGFESTHVEEPTEVSDVSLAGLEPTTAGADDELSASVSDSDVLEGFEATSFDAPPEDVADAGLDIGIDDAELAGADSEEDHAFDLPLLGEAEAEEEEPADSDGDYAFELPTLEEPDETETAADDDMDVAFELPSLDEADTEDADEIEDVGFELPSLDQPLLDEDGAVEPPAEAVPDVRLEEPAEDVLAAAREAVAAGDVQGGVVALGMLTDRLSGAGEFGEAAELASRLLEQAPDEVRLHQLRVEFAEQADDPAQRLHAYLQLAAALDRTNAPTKARAMYQHVLDLDPENATARAALGQVAESGAAAQNEYVDLASLIDADQPSGDTRYFVEETEPTGDEDHDFAELLAQFKAKVSEHVSVEDAGAHYDLGLAFKEMGLVDEAIAEFQVALRSGDERLKIYEELGQCFMVKEQYNVATKVFGRALQMPYDDELELIGVYYHLGRSLEELGRPADARDAYERVMTLDINFQDVSKRLARL